MSQCKISLDSDLISFAFRCRRHIVQPFTSIGNYSVQGDFYIDSFYDYQLIWINHNPDNFSTIQELFLGVTSYLWITFQLSSVDIPTFSQWLSKLSPSQWLQSLHPSHFVWPSTALMNCREGNIIQGALATLLLSITRQESPCSPHYMKR